MTDKNNSKHKHVQFTYYDVGEGNYLRSYIAWDKTIYFDGSIKGERIQIDGRDLEEIWPKLVDYLTNAQREHTIKASACEGLALKIKLNKGLEEKVKAEKEKK
jgi:hypothetical protein